jgi:hypothetical protein
VKVNREHLIKQAGSKYDPEMTVVRAKALRMRTTDEHMGEAVKEEKKVENIFSTSPHQQTTFTLPDSAQKINELITIIQTHKGDKEIIISNKTFFLNEEGIQKIQDLLVK